MAKAKITKSRIYFSTFPIPQIKMYIEFHTGFLFLL